MLHVLGRQAWETQQCRITRQQYGSKLEAAGIQATLYVMMCTVKTHHLFLVLHLLCFIDSVHLFGSFIFLPGMPYNLLASVSVHAWVACLWSCPSVEARDLLFWSCYIWPTYSLSSNTHDSTNPSSDPSPCRLSLSFIRSHPSGFHLVLLLCGRVVALWDTRKMYISCSPSPCLGLSSSLIHNFS